MTKMKKVAVIGDWHLAFVTSAVLADVGHDVTLVKPLHLNSQTWTGKFPPTPVVEINLPEMIEKNVAAGRLHYQNGITTDLQAEIIWMAIDTPVSDKDEPQLEPLLQVADEIGRLKTKPGVFAVSSQIPLTFSFELQKRSGVSVVYIPENLRLGKGIETFFAADRTVLGSDDPKAAQAVQELMANFKTEFLVCNLVTSEMVKHANNAFLATSISFSNELARIAEKFGVDSVTVGKALKLDKRIGQAAYVIPGLGFAGGTLPRDLRVLQNLARKTGTPSQLVDAVLDVNENTTAAISETVHDYIAKNNLPKTVLVLGYTYKAETDTLRRSLSIDIANILKAKGYEVIGYDPMMNGKDLSAIKGIIEHCPTMSDIKTNISVTLLMTARPTFKEFDWSKIKGQAGQQLVFDTQNFLNGAEINQAGFLYKRLWSPMAGGSK
ncbi:MAG: UDP-glucose 6-dehydrogenase TuaD [Oligoflexia bacterium]|nr:MAG: UDP-glucose 6-dehydrogenase TuaD [Oligoflexia bacterium]